MTETVQCDHLAVGALRCSGEVQRRASLTKNLFKRFGTSVALPVQLGNQPETSTTGHSETSARTVSRAERTAQSVPLKLNQYQTSDLKRDHLISIDLILPRAHA
ncbi:hypothetical protein MST27_17845 [Pseudomonas sp. PS1]|uniref:Uncharacterized protein n=1 Tax=Stutzerimonas marianensis TaxID=2929513 RepID=A0A9X1W4P7_9GAMM|nr:hypothetical protein [Pseudomonas marianensis]MCJ0975236.1 hypothetical protein [Pseudomonas marianensis]